jgi:hypothetical protein
MVTTEATTEATELTELTGNSTRFGIVTTRITGRLTHGGHKYTRRAVNPRSSEMKLFSLLAMCDGIAGRRKLLHMR